MERRQALADSIAARDVETALQVLDLAGVVLRGDFWLLKGPL